MGDWKYHPKHIYPGQQPHYGLNCSHMPSLWVLSRPQCIDNVWCDWRRQTTQSIVISLVSRSPEPLTILNHRHSAARETCAWVWHTEATPASNTILDYSRHAPVNGQAKPTGFHPALANNNNPSLVALFHVFVLAHIMYGSVQYSMYKNYSKYVPPCMYNGTGEEKK